MKLPEGVTQVVTGRNLENHYGFDTLLDLTYFGGKLVLTLGITSNMNKKLLAVILLLVLIILANFFLYQFYRQEKYVYFWDWTYYESTFAFMAAQFHLGLYYALKS